MDPTDIKLISLANGASGFSLALLDTAALAGAPLAPLCARYLSANERRQFDELVHVGRRSEWLGARICLKRMLLEQSWIDRPSQCELRKDSRGRPWLVGLRGARLPETVDCSLSHQGRWACASLSTQGARIGVDVEPVSSRLVRLAEMFVGQRDRPGAWHSLERRLTILWTLKEAASKALGLGIGVGLSEVVCRAVGGPRHNLQVETYGARLSAWHFLYEDLVVAVALLLDRSDARGVAPAPGPI